MGAPIMSFTLDVVGMNAFERRSSARMTFASLLSPGSDSLSAGRRQPRRRYARGHIVPSRINSRASYCVSPSVSLMHDGHRETKRWRSGLAHQGSSSGQALMETCSGSTSNSVRSVVPHRVQKFLWMDLPEAPVRVYRVSRPTSCTATLSMFTSVTNGEPPSRWQSRQWQRYT
jgi:hypothetical protein